MVKTANALSRLCKFKIYDTIPAILTTSGLIALAIIYLDVVKVQSSSAFKVLMFIFNESVIVLRETNAMV